MGIPAKVIKESLKINKKKINKFMIFISTGGFYKKKGTEAYKYLKAKGFKI